MTGITAEFHTEATLKRPSPQHAAMWTLVKSVRLLVYNLNPTSMELIVCVPEAWKQLLLLTMPAVAQSLSVHPLQVSSYNGFTLADRKHPPVIVDPEARSMRTVEHNQLNR